MLGEAADAGDSAAHIENAGQIESRGRSQQQAGSHGRTRAIGLGHRGSRAGECESVVGEGRQADGAEMQPADRERRGEVDQAARADERGRVSVGIRPGDTGGSIEPLRISGAPDTGATQSGTRHEFVTSGSGITVPIKISGLRFRCIHQPTADHHRCHHEGGAGQQSGRFVGGSGHQKVTKQLIDTKMGAWGQHLPL